jgi:citrate synthase
MFSEALPGRTSDSDLDGLERSIVDGYYSEGRTLPGLGHPLHESIDPRVPRLFELATETGHSGPYLNLMKNIHIQAARASAKPLPINTTGAIGAICCELGFSWKIVRGFGVMARAIGLVGHILGGAERPMAVEVWQRAEDEATRHIRPVYWVG